MLAPLGELNVGDKPGLGVKITHKEHREMDLFFDKETGLLRKLGIRLPDMPGGQEVEWEFLFSDAKEFGGVKHFTKMTLQRDGKKLLTMEVEEVKPQEKLDESLFAKP
jgi:hypothetical protein